MIEFHNVTLGYSGANLLSDVSMKLAPGSFHFLTGPSGTGKTSLIKLCYGELASSAGRVEVFGQDIGQLPRDELALMRRRVGIVHQDCQFLDHLSVAENVLLPLEVAGQEADNQSLGELLAWVGLTEQAQSLPPSLSGGERQRAALARAVITAPDIILADEPTGNIDWEMSLRLLRLLTELNRMGKTILVATHDLNLIRSAKAQLSARVLRIQDRKLTLAGADL
ncbi:MAG: ATP-binding cassette domain-containing protein [Paracoccaceae bacterium]